MPKKKVKFSFKLDDFALSVLEYDRHYVVPACLVIMDKWTLSDDIRWYLYETQKSIN